MIGRRSALKVLGGAALAAPVVRSAAAQAWPPRQMRIVVPFAAGGRADGLARIIANGLQHQFGQPVIVDNRAGGSGIIGTDAVAKSTPDGLTLLLSSTGTQSILPIVNRSLPYHPERDFTPVANLVESFSFIGIYPSLRASTLAEFVALARAQPGRLNFASSGVGTYNHFAGEFFNLAAGTQIGHVAYRGSGPSVTDLIAGHVQMMIGGEFLEQAAGGRVRILATTNQARWPELPEVPTMAQAGLPQFTAPALWFGLVGPGGVPADIVRRINEAVAVILRDGGVQQRLRATGSLANAETPEAFAERIRSDLRAFADLAARANMRFEE